VKLENTSQLIRKQFFDNKKSWENSLLEGLSVDENNQEIPWYSYDSIKFLENFLQKNHHVFEYGCGASTLFFSKRVKYLTGIETDITWLKIIEKKIIEKKFLIDNNISEILSNKSYSLLSSNHNDNFKDYSSIKNKYFYKKFLNDDHQIDLYYNKNAMIDDNYPNFCNNFLEKFDVIIIDSKKRFPCSVNAIKSLKPNGIIILDDSQRDNYRKIFNFFLENNFKKIDFIGIASGQLSIKNTTIFYK
jgi:SAM-dependent methyltransferase